MHKLPTEIRKSRILVVDDAPSMRSLLVCILKSFGVARIYEAADAKAATKQLNTHEVDLIFCDWEMPNKTGLEFFEELREQQAYSQIPFVLVTSVAETQKVRAAIQAGVQHYIVKPFKEVTIMEKLEQLYPEVSGSN